MRNLLVMVVMSITGALGWWLGSPLGLYGSLVISMVASGVGLYFGRKGVEQLLP